MDQILARLGFVPASRPVPGHEVAAVLSLSPKPATNDYAAFLAAYGGGDFEHEVVVRCAEPPPQAEQGRCLFGVFFGVPDGESSLVTVWRRAEELLSAGLVPFASAPGGDIYCFRSEGDVVDLVLWDHESGASYLVAASFQDFLDRLELAPIAAATDLRSIKIRLDPDLL